MFEKKIGDELTTPPPPPPPPPTRMVLMIVQRRLFFYYEFRFFDYDYVLEKKKLYVWEKTGS